MGPGLDGFLTVIRTESRRFADAAAGCFDDPVPTCPEWTGADLMAHLGIVHRHKERIVREGLAENPGVSGCEPPDDPGDLLPWFAEGVDLLVDTLEGADPDAACWTFHPADRTVGFWFRRLAHETAVHRADAELTAGEVPTRVDPAFAVDGLDEVLGPVFAGYDPADRFVPDGRVVALETSVLHAVRRLHLGDGPGGPGWVYGMGENGGSATRIGGRACDLYLWAWGRLGDEVITVAGDPSLAGLVRATVARAT